MDVSTPSPVAALWELERRLRNAESARPHPVPAVSEWARTLSTRYLETVVEDWATPEGPR
jgi:hypothetical protein